MGSTMLQTWSLLVVLLLGQPETVQTKLVQVHPASKEGDALNRSDGQDRAVLLIPGLHLHTFRIERIAQPRLHEWQKPGSHLVKALSKDADVFAFSYGQNVDLETLRKDTALVNAVKKIQFLGYKELVIVSHSAGGVIARMLVEDHPKLGVTRVIQICSPNVGCTVANATIAVRKDQEPFVLSLTKAERQKCLEQRAKVAIPKEVEFLCVVGVTGSIGDRRGDGLINVASQWPEDLHKQGIPAVRLATSHFTVMRDPRMAERIAELALSSQPRWSEEQVREGKKSILGK